MREITGGLMATHAWIRLGAVWVNMILAPLAPRNNAFPCSLCRRVSPQDRVIELLELKYSRVALADSEKGKGTVPSPFFCQNFDHVKFFSLASVITGSVALHLLAIPMRNL